MTVIKSTGGRGVATLVSCTTECSLKIEAPKSSWTSIVDYCQYLGKTIGSFLHLFISLLQTISYHTITQNLKDQNVSESQAELADIRVVVILTSHSFSPQHIWLLESLDGIG